MSLLFGMRLDKYCSDKLNGIFCDSDDLKIFYYKNI